MSGIIWGIINLDGNNVSDDLEKIMMEPMEKYKIDKWDKIKNENVLMGCGLQFITTESLSETLPYYDVEDKLLITADAIIDNREELLKEFELLESKVEDYTDSEYILMAYKKWGEECAKYLLGDFSFTIWDEKKQQLLCARDHLGRRTYYYYHNKGIFAFCTVSMPLVKLIEGNEQLNERWITDYLSLDCGQSSEDEETIFSNIKQLQGAHTLVVANNKFEKHRYWNHLEKIKELKLDKNDECIKEFMNIYIEAVKCRLRGLDDIGLMVSGGLDSASVAAIASKLLKNQGKILKTFTAVPIDKFIDNTKNTRTKNESDDVILLSEFIGNMEPYFYNFKESNAVNVIDNLIDTFERPYKILQNSHWLNNLFKEARNKECRVLLNGSYGNLTISYGDFDVHQKTLLSQGKLIKLIKEINDFGRKNNISRKQISKKLIKSLIPYKIILKRFYKKNPDYDRFISSPVKNELIEKWNVRQRFDYMSYNMPTEKIISLKELKECIIDSASDSDGFCLSNKMALANGIILRDPTADIRIVEFCLSLPTEMFVQGGVDRLLIRNAMKGVLPERIRMNMNSRGLQGADWIQRLIPIWGNIYKELEEIIHYKSIEKYIDIDKVRNKMEITKEGISEKDEVEIRFLLETLIFARFINKYNKN